MTVSTISSFAAGLSRTLTNQQMRAANSLGVPANHLKIMPSGVDISGIADSGAVRNQLASLRSDAQNVAQATALTEVATAGVKAVATELDHLQQLAVQAASGTLSDADRQTFTTEFHAVRQTIRSLVDNTRFDNQPVLDGSLAAPSADLADASQNLAIGSLADAQLFGGAELSLQSPTEAAEASAVITRAQTYVATQLTNIGAFSAGLQFAAASMDVAVQNQQAAASQLNDSDFAHTPSPSAAETIQSQSAAALLAQTSRLSSSALALLVE